MSGSVEQEAVVGGDTEAGGEPRVSGLKVSVRSKNRSFGRASAGPGRTLGSGGGVSEGLISEVADAERGRDSQEGRARSSLDGGGGHAPSQIPLVLHLTAEICFNTQPNIAPSMIIPTCN